MQPKQVSTPAAKPDVITMHRLGLPAMEALEKACPQMAVTNDTSAHSAGFQLGIQFVFKKLREGFVVG